MLEQTIIESIDSYLLKAAEEEAQKHKKTVPYCYPSGIADCLRKQAYKLLGYEEPMTPQLLRIFECGKSMHERYQKWFEEIGWLKEKELPFKDSRHRVSGRIDGILEVPGRGRWILELKSANRKSFDRMEEENAPLKKYVMQVMLYMALMPYKHSLVVVECKDTQRMRAFSVKYQPSFGKKVLDRVDRLISCVDAGKLPPREHDSPDSPECRRCAFAGMCWK